MKKRAKPRRRGKESAKAALSAEGKAEARRRTAFKIAAVLLALLASLGVPEALVRIFGPAMLNKYEAVYFAGDPNSPLLFINDPILHWRLRPGADVSFLNTSVRVNGDGLRGPALLPERKLVLCVGDSTVFGWRVQEDEAFSRKLEDLLNATDGSRDQWQVVNAGVPGYSSLQVRNYAQELLNRCRPRCMVVHLGNNEAWPAEKSDLQLYRDGKVWAKVERLLMHSRFFLYLQARWQETHRPEFIATTPEISNPRVSREEFADNLKAIVQTARERNIPVILAVPAVNVYYPPLQQSFMPLPDQVKQQWAELGPLMERGEAGRAMALAEKWLKIDPQRFDLTWLRGMILTLAGEKTQGLALIEAAIDKQPFPTMCKPSYRQAIKDCAAGQGVPCVDLHAVLTAAAGGGPSQGLFLDGCHPTPIGHEIIAGALRDAVAQLERRMPAQVPRPAE